MPYPPIHRLIGVSRTLGSKLPYRPLVTVRGVEELDQRAEWIAVGTLRVGGRGPRGGDDCGGEVRWRFLMLRMEICGGGLLALVRYVA